MLNVCNYRVEGFLKIKDLSTQEILVDKFNAIHFGNLSASMAEAISGRDKGHIRYMAFGNGGTFINGSSELVYRSPNVKTYRDTSSALYNETFFKEIDGTTGNTAVAITSTTSYTDVKVTCTLDFNDAADIQLSIDRNTTSTAATFDELAIYTGNSGFTIANGNTMATSDTLLVTHVIFHPIQKALNRILEVDYTIRIHLE